MNEFKKYDLFDVTVFLSEEVRIFEKITESELSEMIGKHTVRVDKVRPCLKLGDKEILFSSVEEREVFLKDFFMGPLDGEISFNQKQDDILALQFVDQDVLFSSKNEKNDFLENFVLGEDCLRDNYQKNLTFKC